MDVPLYHTELRRIVLDRALGPVLADPMPIGPIPDRISAWRPRRAEKNGTLVYCHADGSHSDEDFPGRRVTYVAPEEYYRLRLGHELTPADLLLDLLDEELFDPAVILATEAAILRDYRERFQRLLLPPVVLTVLTRATRGPAGTLLASELESAREEMLDPILGRNDLSPIWVERRMRAAVLGFEGHLPLDQVRTLEWVVDLLRLQGAAHLDLVWAEETSRARPTEYPSVCSALGERFDTRQALYEQHFTMLLGSERFRQVPAETLPGLAKYLKLRAASAPGRPLTDPAWEPDLTTPAPIPDRPAEPARPSPKPHVGAEDRSVESGPGRGESDESAPQYLRIRAALSQQIIGASRNELIDDLALVILLFRMGHEGIRLLLTGPTGSGKTFAARAVAEAAGAPFAVVSATDLVETGYHGMNVRDLLVPLLDRAGSAERAARGVLVVDEIDKVLLPTALVDTVGYEKRKGQQECLLGLVGGGTPIRVGAAPSAGTQVELETSGMLIIMTGAFSTCGWTGRRPPTTRDLIRAGFLPELAERIGQSYHLPPRTSQELAELFRQRQDGVPALTKAAQQLGYRLEIAEATYGFLARAVEDGRCGMGPRGGLALLVGAARRRLISLLKAEGASGSEAIVAPDDLTLDDPGHVSERESDGGTPPAAFPS